MFAVTGWQNIVAFLLAVHWQNTITTGSILIATIIALIGFAEAVHMIRRKNRITDLESDLADLQREMENADRAAKRWEVELRAAQASEHRVALEQQEIRHDLKDRLAACQLELAAANMRTDIASTFVVFMLCAPGVPMMTYLDETEIAQRAHMRWTG